MQKKKKNNNNTHTLTQLINYVNLFLDTQKRQNIDFPGKSNSYIISS